VNPGLAATLAPSDTLATLADLAAIWLLLNALVVAWLARRR
jgi:hypothetical protein